MTPEWRDCYESGIFTEFMEQRGPGHTVGSCENLHQRFPGLSEDIQDAMDKLDFLNDPEALDKQNELKAMSIACDAIMTWQTLCCYGS